MIQIQIRDLGPNHFFGTRREGPPPGLGFVIWIQIRDSSRDQEGGASSCGFGLAILVRIRDPGWDQEGGASHWNWIRGSDL